MLLSRSEVMKFGGICCKERKKKMPKFVKKFGVKRCAFWSVVIFLILLIIEDTNILDIGYLCLFLVYGIRFQRAKYYQD